MPRTRWRLWKIARESCGSEPKKMRATECALAYEMRESVSDLKRRTNSLKLSTPRKAMEWESGCRSAGPLSRLITDVSGQYRMTDPASLSRFLFLVVQRAS